eukprot:s854_g12.t1
MFWRSHQPRPSRGLDVPLLFKGITVGFLASGHHISPRPGFTELPGTSKDSFLREIFRQKGGASPWMVPAISLVGRAEAPGRSERCRGMGKCHGELEQRSSRCLEPLVVLLSSVVKRASHLNTSAEILGGKLRGS